MAEICLGGLTGEAADGGGDGSVGDDGGGSGGLWQ
jgi:hypothetical protein